MNKWVLILLLYFSNTLFSQSIREEKVDSVLAYSKELMSTNADKAYVVIEDALESSKAINYSKGEADAYYRLSEYYRIERKGDECLDYLYKALEIYKQIGNKKGMADVYNDIGLTYDEFEIEGDVLGYYNKSLQINKEIDNKEDMIVNYINISMLHLGDDDVKSCFAYLDTSIFIAKSIGDSVSLAHSYNTKGYVYEATGDKDQAINYYELALDIFKRKGLAIYQMPTMINIAYVYSSQEYEKKEQAIEILKEVVEISAEVGEMYYAQLATNFIHQIYAMNGEFKSAYEFHKVYKAYSDSLSDTEGEKRLVELSMKHEFAMEKEQIALEQEKKDLAAAEELKRSQIVKNSFIGGFILILILAVVSFRAFKNKKRASEEIAEKNKEITDSINYAKRLQTAILSPSNKTDDELENLFVFFRPKDIVSGDFYWVDQNPIDESVMFAAIDCTGHGVPGAMLSIVGNNVLENIINNQHVTKPELILELMNNAVYKKLEVQGNREMGDGMDMALCRFDKENKVIQYAGANNPVYIVRNGEVIMFRATKKAIGQEAKTQFVQQDIPVKEGDTVYVFSDGYSDQFGGDRGKKMGSKEFKRFLVSIQNLDMDSQRKALEENIEEWMGGEEQIDDICVIGFRV